MYETLSFFFASYKPLYQSKLGVGTSSRQYCLCWIGGFVGKRGKNSG